MKLEGSLPFSQKSSSGMPTYPERERPIQSELFNNVPSETMLILSSYVCLAEPG
jgi:hypothetical protein